MSSLPALRPCCSCFLPVSGDVKFQSSVLKDALPRSERSVRCLGPVDGFTLEAEDIDYVCTQFYKDLQGDNVQRALK